MSILTRLNPNFAAVRRVDYAALQARIDSGSVMLGWADPFFPDPCLPPHVIAAATACLMENGSHYTSPIGSPMLRQAIARKLARFNGLTINPDTELIVTPGSDTGLWHAMQVVLSPGDEVISFVPSYPSNTRNASLMGAINVPIALQAADDFRIDTRALQGRLTDRTKLLVLTQPNNPTGTVHSRRELEALSEFARENDLIVIVDHAFEDLVYDGREFVTFAALPGMAERTISVFSMSKGMAMSGFRVGYTAAPEDIMAVMHGSAVNVLGATNTAAQAAATAALSDSAFVDVFRDIYDRRRSLCVQLLGAVDGLRVLPPQGGLMLWLNISALGTSQGVAGHLATDAAIIVQPGDIFGEGGEGYIRIMLSALRDDAAFASAIKRTAVSLAKLPPVRKQPRD
ncbi:pyridoxal phosphate-dependent aminotransferase [soil metagenome]